jgi:hypothetical protein
MTQAFRYDAIPDRHTEWLEGHAATTPTASPNHASDHQTAMATRYLWTWQLKHLRCFLTQHLKNHSDATRYYYQLTAVLIWKRVGKDDIRTANPKTAASSLNFLLQQFAMLL